MLKRVRRRMGDIDGPDYTGRRIKSIDSCTIAEETDGMIEKAEELDKLGKKYEDDIRKLKVSIDKVMNSDIPKEDMIEILRELREALKRLLRIYREDVWMKEKQLHDEIQSKIEQLQAIAASLAEQEAYLRGLTMNEANEGTSAAADEAAKQRREIEATCSGYFEKLKILDERMETRNKIFSQEN